MRENNTKRLEQRVCLCCVDVIIIYFLSLKDFAVSGIRFGTLYTENQDVANAIGSLCYFHGVCGPVQYKIAQLLRDRGETQSVKGPQYSTLSSLLKLLLFTCYNP